MFIDIHQHLVHGIDDGPRTFEETKRMLWIAKQNGVTHIIATSHAAPGREPFPYETYLEHLRMAQEWCLEEDLQIQLYPGAEILYTEETVRLLRQKQMPTLAGTDYVLVEFYPDDSYDRLCLAARRIGNAGYRPIYAHVERYKCLKDMEHVYELREKYQIRMQMNAQTLLTRQGFFRDRWIWRMFQNEFVDFIATDAHDAKYRKCDMAECFKIIKARYGGAVEQKICFEQSVDMLNSIRKYV